MSSNIAVIESRATAHAHFNYEFPIFTILSGVIAVFFLLYFNRVFASVVSYAIRSYTWHKHRVYIDITALQISLLAGRIFFTGLRYHGPNESFLVQHGYITWRYWFRRVREVDVLAGQGEGDEISRAKEKNKTLPCRIDVKLTGLEWFAYNRSPAYNSILAGLTESLTPDSRSSDIDVEKDTSGLRPRDSGVQDALRAASPAPRSGDKEVGNASPSASASPSYRRSSLASGSFDEDASSVDEQKLPFMLEFFPIHVECQKAAAVIGNENTKAILIVKADSVQVDVDAQATTTPDPYRQVYQLHLHHPVIQMKENEDYKEGQAARVERENQNEPAETKEPISRRHFFHHQRRKVLSSLRNLVPLWQRSVESVSSGSRAHHSSAQIPGSAQWQGLSRYLDDQDQSDRARWGTVEYAAVETILDCPSAVLTAYWDIVAKVTPAARRRVELGHTKNINGDQPPAWGMHFVINGGTLNYGPWADRQRADLQRVFFPTLAKDAVAAQPLAVGDWRAPTEFKLFVELQDAVTFRIPIREESKNWRWRGKEPPMRHDMPNKRNKRNRKKDVKGDGVQMRPAGWLEMKVPADSTVAYHMDMFASEAGYENRLDLDMPSSEMRSSVNHDILWFCGPQHISCDLSNPRPWNTLRNWNFDVSLQDLKMYLLRDHIFLLIDLVDDWSTGPPSEYLVFTPFKYHLHLDIRNLELYLNINDANVVDSATAADENAYLILSTPRLSSGTCIPINQYRPSKNAIPFEIRAEPIDLSLNAPQWNTLAPFLPTRQLAHVEVLLVDGSYHYNATSSPANTDTLVLNLHGQSPHAHLFGYLVRYFILLKDNYFGDHVHFRTLDEYREQIQSANERTPDTAAMPRPPNKKSNDLDVILAIKAEDCRIMVPTNLYSADTYLQGELASLSVDLRFTNYFMDIELDLSPLNLSLGSAEIDLDSPNVSSSNTEIFIDGIRVFGHRLFGLPPSEPTYMCNYDVSVGKVSGECTTDFVSALARAGKAFAFTFDDVENALVPYSSLIFHDITFIRVAVHSIYLWLHVDDAAFLVSTDTIEVKSNDWARSHYTKRADIEIPNIQISCVNAESAARHKARPNIPIATEATLQTDLRIATIGRKYHFSEERRLQQELVRREDQRTHRTQFLLIPDYLDDFVPEPVDPPAQSAPPPPEAIVEVEDGTESLQDSLTKRKAHRITRQSSFLSQSSLHSTQSNRQVPRKSLKPGKTRLTDTSQENVKRPTLARRDHSASSGRHSSFYSASGDFLVRESLHHSSVAFSSQYFGPHFPLEGVYPSSADAPSRGVEEPDEFDFFDTTASALEDIDPANLSEEHAYSSTLIGLPNGITVVVNPASIRYITSLLSALQPSTPDDILDSLQTKSMTEIFDSKKQEEVYGRINDILVRVPRASVRLLNSSTLDSPDPSQEERDQYDMVLSRVALMTRTSAEWDEDSRTYSHNPKTSFHFRLGSADLTASERLSSEQNPQAAFMAHIGGVMASLGTKDVSYFDIDVSSIVGSTASGKIEYLASLIHRTGNVASELGQLFSHTTNRHHARLKFLTYRLLEDGRETQDPSFLIRPSAVLRSAPQHLRTFDSWKLIVRLRQILSTLSAQARALLLQEMCSERINVPPGVSQRVIAEFERWRSWDFDNLQSSILLSDIFGRELQKGQGQPTGGQPLLGVCRLADLQFVLDPGPRENKVGLADLTTRVEKRPRTIENSSQPDEDDMTDLIVANIFCGDVFGHVNWDLCELAEDVARLYNQSQSPEAAPTLKVPNNTGRPRPSLHIVLEVFRGSLDIETVNLTLNTLSDGFKMSLLAYSQLEDVASTSLMLNSSAITCWLSSHSQRLGTFQLRDPSVFVSHDVQDISAKALHTIRSTASSKELTLTVKEDPTVLLGVIDKICQDEAAQLNQLSKSLPQSHQQEKTTKISDRLSTFRVNIAVFLDRYKISVPLVQSLTYNISGVVARAACAANFGKELIFDFDIKENSHEMQINVRNEPRSISLLQIPPTNGRLTHMTNASENSWTVLSSVEVVRLDASAVYNLLSALNRPQITNAIEEMQEQAKAIQQHTSDIFGSDKTPPAKQSSKGGVPNVYNVRLVFAGLQVIAKTALKSDLEPVAQVIFSLDKAYLQASNRVESHGPTLKYPDLHLNLRHIGLDISRGRDGALRSCGHLSAGATVSASSKRDEEGKEDWSFNFRSDEFDASLSPETISTVIGVLAYLGEKIKDLDTSRELEYLRKLRKTRPKITLNDSNYDEEETDILDSVLATVIYHFELRNIRLCWLVAEEKDSQDPSKEDLVLSIKLIEFGTRTRRSARLAIEDFQLQAVPPGQDKSLRSLHSALLPEVIFNIAYLSTANTRRIAFQAVGESLDLRLTSAFIVPTANLVESISKSMEKSREATADWNNMLAPPKQANETPSLEPQRSILGKKRFESILVDADFAGAVVYMSSKTTANDESGVPRYGRPSMTGKYGQFNTDDSGRGAILRSPGLAWKAEYQDNGQDDPVLYGEIKIAASRNILYPSVVPLVMDIVASVKEVVSDDTEEEEPTSPKPPRPVPEASGEEDNILTADPTAVLGRVRLNLGLRICRQEFTLSCQPYARVAATAWFDNIYFAINTVSSPEHGNFFAISGVFTKLQASVKHIYSRESTGSFEVDSITASVMNSKHVSGISGVSAILNVEPMKMLVNAKQVQDFLLFREIWYPKEMRRVNSAPVAKLETETSQGHLVQRYQQVAATAAFPWTVTISIAALDVKVDLGQAIGRSDFLISDFWVSSKKTSDWEQNLCLGFKEVEINCSGRLSGFIGLQQFQLRTSIQWPRREEALNETPLVQASVGFNAFRLKAAFDYQAFLVADITTMELLMYNVRESRKGSGDRLVAIFDGEAVQVFGTTTSAAQAVALYQAIQRLIQERKESFEKSLKEMEEKAFRPRANTPRGLSRPAKGSLVQRSENEEAASELPISLDTDVVVTLKALNLGIFPSTFSDHQVLKMEALNAYARFAASVEDSRVHSILRMELGQLRIGLAGVRDVEAPKSLNELSVEHVVQRATGSRGGTILKVPQVAATMETWQTPDSNHIDYIFKSAFEGKVEVGWNYSRISYIRGMLANHAKSLEQVWGHELPISAVKITGVPETEEQQKTGEQQKITAEVNVPQSKYDYTALEPPIIVTPQLRDMGEATPPLEWIGLHRERLPNLTHQIVIVSLLELAGEVEDAYSKILGSS